MHLHYDDDFVEGAVGLAAGGRRRSVPALQIRRFHAGRERCYAVLDPDERNAAFFRVHLEWFREWGLEALLLRALHAYPLVPPALTLLAFRKVRTRRDEAAELYVNAEQGRSAVVAMRPERFERDEWVETFLRHEFMHLSDMLDPAFGYAADLRGCGVDPARQRIVRERYRLLWDITIDGRLHRERERERHRGWFDRAYGFWDQTRRAEVFARLWNAPSPRHDELLRLAADPRDVHETTGPLPGAACPLCGFSTFEWAAPDQLLDPAVRGAIEREFPGWSPAHGACARCADVYAAAGSSVNALPL